MLKSIVCTSLCHLNKMLLPSATVKQIHNSVIRRFPRKPPNPLGNTSAASPALATKYQIITEDNSPIIENTDEEIKTYSGDSYKYPIISDEFDGINLQRGKTGVYDIEDLVNLLRRENCKDIFVATVPKSINYVDHICVVSGKSKRHLNAIAEFVRKVYKKKSGKNDYLPRIEGKDSDEWLALDLGNIALHIFSEKVRKVYDLEMLWSVGPVYDDNTNNKNEIVDIFENYSNFLKDLKPLA